MAKDFRQQEIDYISFLSFTHSSETFVRIVLPEIIGDSSRRLSGLDMIQVVYINLWFDLARDRCRTYLSCSGYRIVGHEFKLLAEDDRYEIVGQYSNVLLLLWFVSFI